jgi:peptidoglycan/xylan/chitin deacetylase (PgdA/CDA1 family)
MAPLLPILTFHAFDNQSSVISFPPRVFKRGMAKLRENGYRTMSLLDAVDCLRMRKSFPERSLVITFDDGYRTIYEVAFPVLQDYGMCATIFLTVGERGIMMPDTRLPSLSGHSMLSWYEILEMHQWGIDFGAHTLTHPDLTCLSVDRIENEIVESKAIIEDALSAPVVCFAYPYGHYNHQSRKLVRQHFACACSDNLGLIHAGSDLYALERVDGYYLRTKRLFDLMLTGLFPWYIKVRSIPRWVRRAIQTR